MKSISAVREALRQAKGGRPREIEPVSNLYFIHPASRALVPWLYRFHFSPNAVSVMGSGATVIAVACFLWLPWPWNAVAGFGGLVMRHVLDGADGLLARVSGRTSTLGDMIDGLCDGFSIFLIQIALAFPVAEEIGPGAYPIAAIGLVSYIVQINAYENRRRRYIHWVYGRPMITPDRATTDGKGSKQSWFRRLLRAAFVSYFAQPYVEARALSDEMQQCVAAGGDVAERARSLYKARKQPVVARFGWLGDNQKSLAASLAMLAGSALYLYVYLFAAMNLVLALLLVWQSSVDRALLRDLAALREPVPRAVG